MQTDNSKIQIRQLFPMRSIDLEVWKIIKQFQQVTFKYIQSYCKVYIKIIVVLRARPFLDDELSGGKKGK